MKKIIFLTMLTMFCFASQAQPYKTVTAGDGDQNANAETDYITLPNSASVNNWFTSIKDLKIQILCTQHGGTSDGKVTIQRSLDNTSWKEMLTTVDTDLITSNDTLTITNGAVLTFRLKTYWPYYRLKIVGTSSDTTDFTTKYAW